MPTSPPILDGFAAVGERLGSTTTGSRRMIGVVGPPGSGKSHLCGELLRTAESGTAIVAMDGFHLDDAVLGDLGLAGFKGRADTFDAAGFVALLRRLRDRPDHVVYAPRFDRAIETAIAGAIAVDPEVDLVLVEGNYLLLDEGPWAGVRLLLDEVWYLDVPAAVRRARLLTRHRVGHGDGAEAWIAAVDEPNALVVERTRSRATFVVRC